MNIIPTAREMSSYLASLSNLLCEKELIYPDSKSSLDHASAKLIKLGASRSWKYTIEASAPINFVPAPDKKLEEIELLVYIDVAVEPPKRNDLPPFKKLDTKIEIFDLAGHLQSRWHIDLANRKDDGSYQEGPLFHLQSGGHKPEGKREDELKISRPRWAMPPMELILTCEMIIANFYPEQWKTIRTEKRWLKLIHIAQSMCYLAYCQRMHNCFFQQQPLTPKKQSDSVLTAFWASEWDL
ncbi:MAG TPA: hypothetical protein EYP59_01130 [Thiotrichaceae bacterium]|nr:hypothetical protein [Thiotrichaceae bacterium]